MFLMRADPLREQVGGGWALEIEPFLGPVKWHRAVRRVPFVAQKISCVCPCIEGLRLWFFSLCPLREKGRLEGGQPGMYLLIFMLMMAGEGERGAQYVLAGGSK